MNKFVLAIAVMTASLFAAEDATSTKTVEDNFKFTPVIKSEFLMMQSIDDGARPSIIFGDNFFGVIATKGDVEVAGVVNLVDYPEYGVVLEDAHIKKGIGENFDITAGYKDLPFGNWTSNCVTFPLIRTGNYDPTYESYIVRTKSPQLEAGFDNGVVVADVAGYVGASGNATYIAAKVAADFTIIAPNISVRADGMDTVDIALGADIDLGVVNIYGLYSRGINADRIGSYIEVSVFPTNFLITSLRGDVLIDKALESGLTSYSLSNLFIITDNLYAGIEYTLQSNVMGSERQTPTHAITSLIGFQF